MDKIIYLLDTNICIHFLNGQFNLNEKNAQIGFEDCYISEITILELLYGVINSDSSKKEINLERLKEYEALIKERILPIHPVFEVFSTQKSRLRKLGTPISDFDLLIGSTALVKNLILVSRNTKEMSKIEGIKLENWID